MATHRKQSNRRTAKILGATVLAGGLLLAAPAGIALADPAADNPGRPGETGGAPGATVSETAKLPGSVPSRYSGKAPGQFVSDGLPPGGANDGGGGGDGPGGT